MRHLLALAVMFAPDANAQDIAAAASAAGAPWWAQLVVSAFGILALAITTIILPAWKRSLDAKRRSDDASGQRTLMTTVALKVEHFTEVAVAEIDATMRPAIAKALEDGTVTDAEKAELRELGLSIVRKLLGSEGLSMISSAMGIGAGLVDQYLAGMLEKKVAAKNAAAPPIFDALPKPPPTVPY